MEAGVHDNDAIPRSRVDSMTAPTPSPPPTSHTPSPIHAPPPLTKWRNIVGFWLLGLLNNYPYVIMLSAAFDIIHFIEGGGASNSTASVQDGNGTSCTLEWNETTNSSDYPPREPCQHQGTSVILLADVLPTFIIKLVSPYFMHLIPYWIRVSSVIGFSLASFLLVAMTTVEAPILLGVVCASISSGFGEIVFLSLTARYHKSTVSAWSSGTGAAGVGGAVVYAVLKTFLSPKVTLLIQLFVPVMMILVYFFVLGPASGPASGPLVSWRLVFKKKATPPPADNAANGSSDSQGYRQEEMSSDKSPLLPDVEEEELEHDKTCMINATPLEKAGTDRGQRLWDHVRYIPRLFQYMVPLFVVYSAEYTINQGLFELLYSSNTHLGHYCMDQHAQYRWLQVVYQVGVLVSRSSVSVIYIRHFWILALLQVVNFVFFFVAAIYLFLPSFWLTFVLIFYEGLLGGAVYVNAFYTITKEVPETHREFSMGVASVADSTGICVAGVSSFLIHTYICSTFIGYINT